MQKYIGGIEGFLEQDAAKESAFWADYQVLCLRLCACL